ncbi:MAG: HAD hydrolase-like protein, partial [Clostridiales bacterium]|nr:HAD hydrolase-like protein [Clostridiales bacterium]
NYTMLQSGYPERSREEVRAFVGCGVKRLIERAVPKGTKEEDIEACVAIFQKHYSANMQNKTCAYDGVLQLLRSLKELGCNMA